VTLGLGEQRQAERVTVRWPSGATDVITNLAAGSEYRVREGSGVVRTTALSPANQAGRG
jgi:hypothetical protein